MNALAHSAMAARDRQCDRGAGVLPHGLILSSIIVGIALFTAGMAAKWSFATALPFMPGRGLKANPVRS